MHLYDIFLSKNISFYFLIYFCVIGGVSLFVVVVVVCFLGLHPQHMEVPRLGVQLELQLLAYATATTTIFFFSFLLFLWAASAAYGGSQARGLIGAVAASLRQSHSNAGSEPRL